MRSRVARVKLRLGNIKKRRLFLAATTFLVSSVFLSLNVNNQTQHGDEKIYVWKSWYFSNKILKFDFLKGDADSDDPGFHPNSFWAKEQPFGTHIIY